MWDPFGIFAEKTKLSELDRSLSDAFTRVKAERRLIFSWLNYLRRKDISNENTLQQMQFKLGEHEAELRNVQEQIKLVREEVKILIQTRKISPFPDQITEVRTKSGPESEPVSGPKSEGGFVKRVIAMIRPQKKDYVLKKILEYIDSGSYTTKHLETVIVREKQLCGRTAFYDYLKELRLKGDIKTDQKNGKKVLVISQN